MSSWRTPELNTSCWPSGDTSDVEVVGGGLVVTHSNLYPPGSPTLSGVVTEATSSGPRPVAGVDVYRLVITGWRKGITDSNGFYEIRGLLNNEDEVSTIKQGYLDTRARLTMSGDTRFDISIVRQ